MSRTRRRGLAVGIAALALMVWGTQANASPIRFDNAPVGDPGHFVWGNWNTDPLISLGITEPASAQPVWVGDGSPPGTFVLLVNVDGTRSDVSGYGKVQKGGVSTGAVAAFQANEAIPSAMYTWSGTGALYRDTYGSNFPEGVPLYLGCEFDLGAGYQYGWIGIVRTGLWADAFAWGYETEPGVPIAAGAPEPGTLAILAFGAVPALLRRRR
jgi:hypothetical protein